ncbi:MAG: hypothetical protein LCH39_01670 [Proteobacteria bacterium]|nr:hypothetical protein [Pseudomonadota bacterium]
MPVIDHGDVVAYQTQGGEWKIATGVTVMGASILMTPTVARVLTASSTSANVLLSSEARAISIYARGGDAYFRIGDGEQTATASSHYIASGERLEFSVSDLSEPHVAAIVGPSGASATLHITELV